MPDTLSLPRLQTTPSLGEQTYSVIRDAIISLDFKPGDRLSVHRLSEDLGVSRTPVKDAFQRLEQEGLVSVVPRTGTFVAPIEVKDIDEILEARALIEGFAASRAALQLSGDELARAEAVLERMGNALKVGEVSESAEIGHEFHVIVLNKLENDRMWSFLKQMDLQYTRIRRIFSQKASRQNQSLKEHYDILETLKARNGDGAYSVMFDHHWSVRDELVLAYEAKNGGNGDGGRFVD